MLQFLIRIKALKRLGLTRPLRLAFLILFVGSLVAGLIYTVVVLNAVNERNSAPHVQPQSSL